MKISAQNTNKGYILTRLQGEADSLLKKAYYEQSLIGQAYSRRQRSNTCLIKNGVCNKYV